MSSLLPVLLGIVGAQAAQRGDPPTVERVELSRYVGTWYEIAAFPKRYQRGCVATEATYTLRPDGDIDVVNTCRKERLDGEVRQAKGKAWVVDRTTNAKLKVQFFWPFRGDYWVLALDADYRWVAVGNPARDSCWILSRTRQLDEATFAAIVDRLRALGFDTDQLRRTLQPA